MKTMIIAAALVAISAGTASAQTVVIPNSTGGYMIYHDRPAPTPFVQPQVNPGSTLTIPPNWTSHFQTPAYQYPIYPVMPPRYVR